MADDDRGRAGDSEQRATAVESTAATTTTTKHASEATGTGDNNRSGWRGDEHCNSNGDDNGGGIKIHSDDNTAAAAATTEGDEASENAGAGGDLGCNHSDSNANSNYASCCLNSGASNGGGSIGRAAAKTQATGPTEEGSA